MELETSSSFGGFDTVPAPGSVDPTADPARSRTAFYAEHNLLIMLMFMLFTIAYYMCWGARRDVFAAIRFEFLLGTVLGLTCIALLVMKPPNMMPARRIIWGAGLLLLAMIVQMPFAADPVSSRAIFVDRVLKCTMLAFYMAVLVQSPRYLRFFLFAFLFACFYITQESVRGLISGGLVWENQGVMRLHGSVRLYAHPNSLAGLAMGTIPFIVYLFPIIASWRWRTGLLLLAGTALTCVIYSGSRTAYVAIIAFVIYWFLMSNHKRRFIVVGLVAGAITLMVLPQQYKERFLSIGGQEASGHSKEKRIVILQDAWQIFRENPGGVGVASFPAVRQARFGRSQDTHNLYLEVATNLGIQGLVVFGFLVYAIFYTLHQARHHYERQRRRLRIAARAGSVRGALLHRIRDHDRDLAYLIAVGKAGAGFIFIRLVLGLFGMDLYEVYWWFASGLAISLINMVGAASKKTEHFVALAGNDGA